jgi:hypothetical protein
MRIDCGEKTRMQMVHTISRILVTNNIMDATIILVDNYKIIILDRQYYGINIISDITHLFHEILFAFGELRALFQIFVQFAAEY